MNTWKNTWWKLVLVLIAVSFPQFGLATLVVGRRTSTEVVVGADSFQEHSHSERVESVCKIGQAGRIFFATAGHFGFTINDRDRRLLFGERMPILARYGGSSLKNFIIDTVKNSGSVMAGAKLLISRFPEALSDLLIWNMKKNPEYYTEKLLNRTVTHVVLFGWENDSPSLVVVDFAAIEGRDKLPVVKPFFTPTPHTQVIMRGLSQNVVQLINDNVFWKSNPIEKVKTVIELQIQATPDKVKAPIDILQVDRAGPQWIQRKPECPDVTLLR
jgi:hypothetical protein